jgi:hypothetical protein
MHPWVGRVSAHHVWKRNMVTVPVLSLFLASRNYKKYHYFLSTHIFGYCTFDLKNLVGHRKNINDIPIEVPNLFSGQNEAVLCLDVCS